jgi:hypothetical protein
MDTYWFAVDKDGHVGYFHSGEAGAVPVEAMQGDEAMSMLSDMENALPRSEMLNDLQGRTPPGRPASGGDHLAGLGGTSFPVLMFLKSLDPVAAEIAAGRARQLPSVTNFAVYFLQLPVDLSERLHDDGLCLGCFFHFNRFEEIDAAMPLAAHEPSGEEGGFVNPEAHGFYYYRHTCENWISGPYGRIGVPANPVHVDQLPPLLRQELKAVQLDVNFAETIHVQPVADHECASWEGQWLDLDGQEHPMPQEDAEELELDDEE